MASKGTQINFRAPADLREEAAKLRRREETEAQFMRTALRNEVQRRKTARAGQAGATQQAGQPAAQRTQGG